MGQFDIGNFDRQTKKKQTFAKGVENELKKSGKWSRWIAEAIFYPQTKAVNQFGRVGYIVFKFRPYYNEDTGVLHTYTPSIMLNKSESFFWSIVKAPSVGEAYWEEKRTRDNTIKRRIGGNIQQSKVNDKRGNVLLRYNKRDDKYGILQTNRITYLNKKASKPIRRINMKGK